MNKLLFIPALLAATQLSHAQTPIKAGTVQVGGGIGYSRTSQDRTNSSINGYPIKSTYTNSQFSIAPSVGFFVADNLAIGINGNYTVSHLSDTQSSGSTAKPKQLQVGAFVQYYQMVSEQFGFTGSLGGGYQYTDYLYSGGAKGFYVGLTPGLVFFPISKLAIGASVGGLNYSYLTSKGPNFSSLGDYKSSTFGANFGLSQLLFSGTYYFGR